MTASRSPYRFRGPETWAAVREAFIAGETAAAVAARFGVTDGAIRQRANREGWTRKALAAVAEAPTRRRATLAEASALRPPPSAGEAAPSSDPGDASGSGPARGGAPAAGATDPHALLDLALRRAGAAMQAGRTEEALRMADLGDRLLGLAEEARRLRPLTLEQAAAVSDELRQMVEAAADRTVRAALADPDAAPEPLRAWARAWRARHAGEGA